jgi:hypothetical protein
LKLLEEEQNLLSSQVPSDIKGLSFISNRQPGKRRHVLCVGVGGDQTHAGPLRKEEQGVPALTSRLRPSDVMNYFRQYLGNKRDNELKSDPLKFKTPTPKGQRAATSKWGGGTDKTEEDGVEPTDFDSLSFKEGLRMSMEKNQTSRVKDDDHEDEYVFQRLKEAAPKSCRSRQCRHL